MGSLSRRPLLEYCNRQHELRLSSRLSIALEAHSALQSEKTGLNLKKEWAHIHRLVFES